MPIADIETIAEAAARKSDCLLTTVRRPVNRDTFMVVFQPSIRATVEITGVLLRSAFPYDLVDLIAHEMKHTSDLITAFLNRIDEGTVEKAESDTIIEFSLGAESPPSTI